MVPKLRIKLREAVLYSKTSDPKARAAGYAHTWFDHTGVDLLALASFPSDEMIRNEIAPAAAEEADSLIQPLHVNTSQLFHISSLRPAQISQLVPTLPSIDTWYDIESEDEDLDVEGSMNVTQDIQRMIDMEQEAPITWSAKLDKKMENLTIAAVFSITGDTMQV
ncbi:hypothetical protein BDQ17DRAFT_1434816 [Cyathus striatus]|nr:hypothetical protein BDQ17DRAFT_1434816 [Cyathus striatus]